MKKSKPEPKQSNLSIAVKFLRTHKSLLILLTIGFVGGFLWLVGLRFFLIQTTETHYHANFAVYINGQREVFNEFTYYEEIAACTSAYADNPKGRVHMHENVNDVIHVHDKRVTYGNFFQNIGWNVGDDYMATLDKVYQTDAGHELVYMINGEKVDNIANRVIGNEDRLLVSYGEKDADLSTQIESVSHSATEVNKYQDPASCSGLNGAGTDSLGNRLKQATFWN